MIKQKSQHLSKNLLSKFNHFVSASLQKQNLKLCYVLECLKARRDNLVKKTSGIALRKGACILNAGSFLMLGGMYVHIGLLRTITKCKA